MTDEGQILAIAIDSTVFLLFYTTTASTLLDLVTAGPFILREWLVAAEYLVMLCALAGSVNSLIVHEWTLGKAYAMWVVSVFVSLVLLSIIAHSNGVSESPPSVVVTLIFGPILLSVPFAVVAYLVGKGARFLAGFDKRLDSPSYQEETYATARMNGVRIRKQESR